MTDVDERSRLLTQRDHGPDSNDFNQFDSKPRGEEAPVSFLVLQATDSESDSVAWAVVSWILKVTFTFGLGASLWSKVPEEKDKHSRARRRMTDLYSLPNLALASHYWNVGVALNFLSTPLSYYLVDTLGVSSASYNQYTALTYLPWCLKVLIGLLSDSVALQGQHRKPYFALGWAAFILSVAWLGCYAEPSLAAVNYLSFLYTLSYIVSDVAADALVVERSAFESEDQLGLLRTEAYVIRSVGGVVGAVLGATLYNKGSWGWGLDISECCLLQAAIPACTLLPLTPWLLDEGGGYAALGTQLRDLWGLVTRRTVYVPMAFIYIYSALQVSNPVWTNYLVEGLGFTNFDLGVVTMVAAAASWVALYVYKNCFFGQSWHILYVWTTLLNVLLSALQLLLIFGLTGDLPKLLFASGDYAMIYFAQYMQFMPVCVLAVAVIPGGTEGAGYALLTTWMNVASEVAYDIGTGLSSIWDVSNCALSEGKVGGLWKLTVLTTALQLSPIGLVFFMFPRSKADVLESLKHEVRSSTAGAIFLAVLVASVLGTLAYSVEVIYNPTDDDDGC